MRNLSIFQNKSKEWICKLEQNNLSSGISVENINWHKLMELIIFKDKEGFEKIMDTIKSTISKKRQLGIFMDVSTKSN